MLSPTRRLALMTALALPVLVALLAYRWAYASRVTSHSAIADILATTRATSSYHLTANVKQTILGRSAETVALRVEGDVVQPTDRASQAIPNTRLRILTDRGAPTADVLMVDGQAYMGRNGQWQRVENPVGVTAPDGDYLGYLVAVVNVAQGEPVKTAAGTLTRYTFGLDGPTYAQYQLERTTKMLAGQVPNGLQLRPSERLKGMTGGGELWVDSQGRARRQILDLTFPTTAQEAASQAHMVIDFSRFGDHVPLIVAPVAGPDGKLMLPTLDLTGFQNPSGLDVASPTPDTANSIFASLVSNLVPGLSGLVPSLPALIICMLDLLLCVVLIRPRRFRRLYTAVVGVTILSMVTSPLLNVGVLVNFQSRMAEAASLDHTMSKLGLTASTEADSLTTLSDRLAQQLWGSQNPSSVNHQAQQNTPASDLKDCRVLYVDQGIDPTQDEDGDGLTNADEWCLGTDYANADSDYDTITDTIEVAGYVDSHGKKWVMDPLLDDTNRDGIADGGACFVNVSTQALVCPDMDGDGVPNLWDDDLDGDGVPNRDDLTPNGIVNPTDSTQLILPPYRPKVDITIQGAATGSVVYVDLQVQPQTKSHLRYSSTWLDWPDDDNGQIQDLDKSERDAQLIPLLEIQSPVKPSLGANYGITAAKGQDDTTYRLWVPLQTVGVAGQVSAFAAHMVFTAAEIGTSLQLTEGRILWLTQANLDSYKNCQNADGGQNSANCDVAVEQSVIASYYEDAFRVTGMSVSETKDIQTALFAAPTSPAISTDPKVFDEGRVMMNLISGLTPSFLGYMQPTLPDIVQNFQTPGAAPYTPTWGITPTLIAAQLKTFTHRDEALATTSMTTTQTFLNANYTACAATTTGAITPTLALAYQETNGALNMGHYLVTVTNGDPTVESTNAIGFSFPLGQAALSVMRRVQLSQYVCQNSGETGGPKWQSLNLAQVQDELKRRYPQSVSDATLTLSELLFNSYYNGRGRIMTVGGQPIPAVGQLANPADFSEFNRLALATYTMPEYMRTVYQLDSLVFNIQNRGMTEALRIWTASLISNNFYVRIGQAIGVPLVKFLFYAYRYDRARLANFLLEFDENVEEGEMILEGLALQQFGEAYPRSQRIFLALWEAWQDISQLGPERELLNTVINRLATEGKGWYVGDPVFADGYPAFISNEAKWYKSAGFKIGVAITAIVLISIWAEYGASVASMSGVARDTATAQAIAATLLTIFQFIIDTIITALASTGVGAIVSLIILILTYIIVGAIAHDWNPLNSFSHLTEWLTKVILLVDLFVNQPEVGATPPNMVIDNQAINSQGAMVGAAVEVSLTSVTTLTVNSNVGHVFKAGNTWFNGRQGTIDDVKNSWAVAEIATDPAYNNGQAPSWTKNYQLSNSANTSGASTNSATFCDDDATVDGRPVTDTYKLCRNTMQMSFTVSQAGRNLEFPFLNQLEASLRYQKCVGFGFYNCSTDVNYSRGPDKDQDPDNFNQARQSITMDFLPKTAEELWNWDVMDPVHNNRSTTWNIDPDGDGLPASDEAKAGTDTANWDTDGDGLSDGYEFVVSKTNAAKADTDGDGLADGFEYSLGLSALNADTDGDGLSDGDEVCHLNPDKTLAGGWDVRLASGKTYHVCSDPTKIDADLDGILDAQEKRAGASPWAPNTAPGFFLNVDPSVMYKGTRYSVLKPGDSLKATLNLVNTTADPIANPMTLGYDTTDLPSLTLAQQTSSTGYTPPTPTSGSGGLTWNFGQSKLYTAEALTVTLQGAIAGSLATSRQTTLVATVPYTDHIAGVSRVISETQQVLIDADQPMSLVSAPTPSQAVKDPILVIRGTASDPTSWPVKVETRISGGGYDTDWQTATNTESWSYAWTTPGDGVYTVQTRATDQVGYVETPSAGVEVIVDKTAPGASFTNLTDGQALTNILNHQVSLEGAATDLLSGAAKVAGVSVIQLSIDRRPWRNVAEFPSAPPTTATWKYTWRVDDTMYGSHTLAVRAVDALGQIGPVTQVKVIVDTLPPTDIWSNAQPQVQAGQTVTFEGHADDTGNIPLPSRPAPLEGGNGQPTLDPLQKATVWLMPNGPSEDTFTAVWLGDIDGDGRADFAVGAPSATVNGVANAGRVSILYGKAGGWPVTPNATALADAPTTIVGTAGAQLGQYITPAGDVNGDGLSDFLVGDPVNSQVYLIFGRVGPLGAVNPTTLTSKTKASQGKIFTVETGQVGTFMAAAGDVNRDGYDDILIGVSGLPGGNGAVYLVLGSDPVKGALGAAQVIDLDSPTATKPVTAAAFTFDTANARAVGVGDLNNDQYADFVISDPNNTAGAASASVYVFFGGPSYTALKAPASADLKQKASASFSGPTGVGKLVAPLGDVNGDGLPDFGYSDGNTPHIAYGRASGWQMGMTPNVTFSGYTPAPNSFIAGVGDVDADGKNDLMLGALSGRAYLVKGRADLATNQPREELSNVGTVAAAPYAAGADVNCDVSSDLLIVPFGLQASAKSAPEHKDVRRALRSELALGPATAPVPLDKLPVSSAEFPVLSAEAKALRVSLSKLSAQRSALSPQLFVDDDYCQTCANDGHTWGTDAFATIQAAVDKATAGNTILIGAGTYGPVSIPAGKHNLTLQGVDTDAVFLDAAGGVGVQIGSANDPSGIKGVTVQGLTIRNASTAIRVDFGGAPGSADLNDTDNIRLYGNLIYLDKANSKGVDMYTSNVDLRHNTLVANASGIVLVTNNGAVATATYLRDNLLVALPNAAPLPQWWQQNNLIQAATFLNTHNGFASQNGANGDWASAPSGANLTQMTLSQAAFYDPARQVYRLRQGSAAIGKANENGDLGYYTYRGTVYVNPTYCEKCENRGRVWGQTAFNDLQAAIASGAQRILVEPGVYREQIYLVNGVEIFGSGAGLTVLAPPQDSAGPLVSAEGVKSASLDLVSLAGEGSQDGLRIEAGASVQLTRSIVRNTATAVKIDAATATVANNTLVGNDNGVLVTNSGDVDVRNTVFAYNTDVGLSCPGCATPHNFNAYWRNGQDLGPNTSSGQGNVFADPRFTDPNHNDYRPLADSPLVDAGDPSDPTPPGSGGRVDIGYVQSAQAAVYVSSNYCAQCLNDGLEWQVDAFDTVQAGVDHIPAIAGVFTVGVDAGTYAENVTLRSGVRLIGSGAEQTVIDAGGSGSALTLSGVTHVEVSGFTLQNAGNAAGNAGLAVAGASNTITVTHTIFQANLGDAANFSTASTGVFAFNTVANNGGAGLRLADAGAWVHARFNIFANNTGAGISASGTAQVFNAYNLFFQNSGGNSAGNVTLDPSNILNKDPLFNDPSNGDYTLQLTSPAVNAIAPVDWQPVPLGGGTQADLGYSELLATPITLLFGKQGNTCALGAAGVASVQVGLSYVTDTSLPTDQTLPTTWTSASLTAPNQIGSYWSLPINLAQGGGVYQGDGLYRLYTRPADGTGNTVAPADSFRAAFIADGTPPTVSLTQPTANLATTAPAIQLLATATDPVPTESGVHDNLARVYFEVDGAVITATRVLGGPGQYQGMVGLADGSHTVTAVAVDRAGNVGRSPAATVSVSTSQNEAALLSPAPNSAVISTTLTLAGAVHFAATDGDGQVEVLVDGVSQGQATLDNPKAQSTTWTKQVTLASEGSRTITLRASRSAGSSAAHDTTVTIVKDSVGPSVSVQAPTGVVSQTITLTGAASDTTSGLGVVEVSVDGGFTWSTASVNGNTWTYTYTAGLGNDYASFPTRVRATDKAGNTSVQNAVFVVDNLGPTPFETSLTPTPGSHLTAPAQVNLSWSALSDGSGQVSVIAVTDQISNTTPTTGAAVTGNTYTASFPSAGAWYVHLVARDGVGNTTTRHYGPWFVGTSGGALTSALSTSGSFQNFRSLASGQADWQSSIIVDGFLHVEAGEWTLATERLDTDPRPTQTQSLWASFDATNLYLGWRGARWGIDGTGYIYLDTQAGGTTTPWTGLNGEAAPVVSGKTLPFPADFVVSLKPATVSVLRWTGSAWQPVTLGGGRTGPNGDTELKLPWAGLGTSVGSVDLRLLAFDDDNGRLISVFPTNQSVLGPWTSAYHWSGITPATVPNVGQPRGTHASLRIAPPRYQAPLVGPDGTVLFILNLTNLDRVPVTDLVLDLAASPGLSLQSIQGAPSQTPGTHWSIPFASLAPSAAAPITVTTRVAADVAAVTAITLTGELLTNTPSGTISLAQGSASLAVDNAGPVVRITPPTGGTLRSGQQTLRGTASDRGGIGFVEVRVGDGPWRTTPTDVGGIFTTLAWQIGIDVPSSGQFVVQARGHDIFGQTGETVSATITVDNVAPTAALTLDRALLRGTSAILSGTTRDVYPQDGPIDRVEVQIDNGPWRLAPGPYLPVGAGGRGWRYTWALPQEEGVQHQISVRAVDAAGNVGQPSTPLTVTVDSIPPMSQIVYPQPGATIPEACLTLPEGYVLLWGSMSDGMATGTVQASVDGGQTWREALLGADAAALLARVLCHGAQAATLDNDRPLTRLWAITMPAPYGELVLRSRAIDAVGNNEALKAPSRVQHVRVQTTPVPTATSIPPTATPVPPTPTTASPTPTATAIPPAQCTPGQRGYECAGFVVVQVWTDLQCNVFFNRGTDFPLAGATVTLRQANGAVQTLASDADGYARFSGVAVAPGQPAMVSVAYPSGVGPCANSPTELTLTADNFSRFTHAATVNFRARVP